MEKVSRGSFKIIVRGLTGLSGLRRLIAMCFRIEAGTRQHFKNDSLGQNKEVFEIQEKPLFYDKPARTLARARNAIVSVKGCGILLWVDLFFFWNEDLDRLHLEREHDRRVFSEKCV